MAFTEKRIDDAITAATKEMGYSKLQAKQKIAVGHFMRGRNPPNGERQVFLLPSVLPLVFDKLRKTEACESRSIAVVVSPLIALMKDQVRAMTRRDVKAVYVGEVQEDGDTYLEICEGKHQLLFMSPEALLTDMKWRDMLQSPVFQENVMVIDEAHCVEKW